MFLARKLVAKNLCKEDAKKAHNKKMSKKMSKPNGISKAPIEKKSSGMKQAVRKYFANAQHVPTNIWLNEIASFTQDLAVPILDVRFGHEPRPKKNNLDNDVVDMSIQEYDVYWLEENTDQTKQMQLVPIVFEANSKLMQEAHEAKSPTLLTEMQVPNASSFQYDSPILLHFLAQQVLLQRIKPTRCSSLVMLGMVPECMHWEFKITNR